MLEYWQLNRQLFYFRNLTFFSLTPHFSLPLPLFNIVPVYNAPAYQNETPIIPVLPRHEANHGFCAVELFSPVHLFCVLVAHPTAVHTIKNFSTIIITLNPQLCHYGAAMWCRFTRPKIAIQCDIRMCNVPVKPAIVISSSRRIRNRIFGTEEVICNNIKHSNYTSFTHCVYNSNTNIPWDRFPFIGKWVWDELFIWMLQTIQTTLKQAHKHRGKNPLQARNPI